MKNRKRALEKIKKLKKKGAKKANGLFRFKYQTMRHIETVRNYLNEVVRNIILFPTNQKVTQINNMFDLLFYIVHSPNQSTAKLNFPLDVISIIQNTTQNYGNNNIDMIQLILVELLNRQEQHDQSKLQYPESDYYEKYTPMLRKTTYGSPEYNKYKEKLGEAMDHHYKVSRHHPEHFPNGINDMDWVDVIEMLCDWKASSLRHDDGDIKKSIMINKKRFGFSDGLADIFLNTCTACPDGSVYHMANES